MNATGKFECILSAIIFLQDSYREEEKKNKFGLYLEGVFLVFFYICQCGLNEGSGNGILQKLNTLRASNDFHYIILWSMLGFAEVWKMDLLGIYTRGYLFFSLNGWILLDDK